MRIDPQLVAVALVALVAFTVAGVAATGHTETARTTASERVAERVVEETATRTAAVHAASSRAEAERIAAAVAAQHVAEEAERVAVAAQAEIERVAVEQETARIAAEAVEVEVAERVAEERAEAARAVVEVPEVPAAPAPATLAYAWTTTISNAGGQSAVDRCAGGLTRWDWGTSAGAQVPYLPIHAHCGGTPILTLAVDDAILIDDASYRVVELRDVPKTGSTAADLGGMGGDVLLQTCFADAPWMRVVGAVRV